MAEAEVTNADLADYDRPPVIEVVYGVAFAPLPAWKLPHIGAFWQRVAAEFPRCEHAPPITGRDDYIDSATGLPIPRVWLINATDDRLVQLQPGRLLFNWRRREDAGPYPRYGTLSDRFFALFQEFRAFVADNHLGDIELSRYELRYINHVFEQDGWIFPDDVGRVVDHLSWRPERYSFLRSPLQASWQARFAFSDGPGTLLVKLSPAKRSTDEKTLLVLELSAHGLPTEAPLDNIDKWFSHARQWIVHGFEDITSDEAQKELWGKHERC
jgi:uncharacterized protein (TIGR04255 family)